MDDAIGQCTAVEAMGIVPGEVFESLVAVCLPWVRRSTKEVSVRFLRVVKHACAQEPRNREVARVAVVPTMVLAAPPTFANPCQAPETSSMESEVGGSGALDEAWALAWLDAAKALAKTEDDDDNDDAAYAGNDADEEDGAEGPVNPFLRRFVASGGVDTVNALMVAFMACSAEVVASCCDLVGALDFLDNKVMCGFTALILAAMQAHPTCENVQAEGSFAMWNTRLAPDSPVEPDTARLMVERLVAATDRFPDVELMLKATFGALDNIADNAGMPAHMAEVGVLRRVLETMDRHQAMEIVQNYGCSLLGKIAQDGDVVTAMVAVDALGRVVTAMRQFPASRDVQYEVSWTLSVLSRHEAGVAAIYAGEPGIVGELLSTLNQFPTWVALHVNIWATLGNLACIREAAAAASAPEGCLRLVESLDLIMASERALLVVFAAIRQFLKSDAARVAVSASPGITARVVAAMARYPASAELQHKACRTLYNLMDTETGCALALSEGAQHRVVYALLAFPNAEGVQDHGISVLMQAARRAVFAPSVIAAGGVECAVNAMRAHPTSHAVLKAVVRFLNRVCTTPEVCERWMDADGMRVLTDTISVHLTQRSVCLQIYMLEFLYKTSADFANLDAIEPVCAVMAAFVRYQHVQVVGMHVIWFAALEEEEHNEFTVAGVCGVPDTFPPELARDVLAQGEGGAAATPEGWERICRNQRCLDAVFAAMDLHHDDITIQHKGCALLLMLCARRSADDVLRIMHPDGFRRVCRAARQFPGNEDIAAAVGSVFCIGGLHPRIACAIAEAGGVETVLATIGALDNTRTYGGIFVALMALAAHGVVQPGPAVQCLLAKLDGTNGLETANALTLVAIASLVGQGGMEDPVVQAGTLERLVRKQAQFSESPLVLRCIDIVLLRLFGSVQSGRQILVAMAR